jgi:phosphate transport system permease protein
MASPISHETAPRPAGREISRRARRARETAIIGSILACALFTIAVTASIIVLLARESSTFFAREEVGLWSFITGTEWSPLLGADHEYGVLPLVSGTLLVTGIAALTAIPLGLVSAIYLSEYAHPKVRAVVKPALEVLAGIPTVVYGYFALVVITPAINWVWSSGEGGLGIGPLLGFEEGFGTYNALSAGLAVGIMCIPTVSSLSEDALQAVPRSLRHGAYASGATRFDVSIRVVVPAALSGIMAAFLLAIARAIGETMIVTLAAGQSAVMTLDPRDSIQTLTAYIVQISTGDVPAGGLEYQSIYAVAATLFVMTFAVTLVGARIRNRFREVYA